MSNVQTFFRELKQKSVYLLENREPCKVKIILGNTACDLDSAACTIAIALHKILSKPNTEELILPVFNLSSDEMKIKTEVVYFLQKMQIPLEDLIYRPDIEDALDWAKQRMQLSVTLVDHHYDESLMSVVGEIFDHHIVQVEIANTIASTIKPVGSCSTLVMQHINAGSNVAQVIFKDYPCVAEMCYGAILLDTVNFNPNSNRFTDLDISMANLVEMNLFKTESIVARERIYTNLLAARNDVSLLTPLQLLFKDYKMVKSVPVCGLTTLVQDFVGSVKGAQHVLKEFALIARATEIVLIGMRIVGTVVTRDLGFYSSRYCPMVPFSDPPCHQLAEHISNCIDPEFQMHLIRFPVNGFPAIKIYQQRNPQLTRKDLIPVMESAYQDIFSGYR